MHTSYFHHSNNTIQKVQIISSSLFQSAKEMCPPQNEPTKLNLGRGKHDFTQETKG